MMNHKITPNGIPNDSIAAQSALELRAGAPKAHGKAGPGRDYWIKELRHREIELVANAENAYARMVEAWREKPPKPKTG
jgi:hypothetical protein